MRKVFVICTLFFFSSFFGQIKDIAKEIKRIQFSFPDTIKGWEKGGTFKLNFAQSLYDNWQSGEVSNLELNTNTTYNFNYQTKNAIWDNLLIINYGLNKANGNKIRKTQDRIEFNSIFGGKMPNNWSYSIFLNLQTQLTNTYNYDQSLYDEHRTAGFLAPLYITTGPGIMWRKNKNLFFNIAPVTAKTVYINGNVHKYNDTEQRFQNNHEIELFGVLPNESFKHKLGFYSAAAFQFDVMKNVKMINRLSLYSNYLENPENIDLDYTMNLVMTINKLLNTQITYQTRYDDQEYSGFQMREAIAIGLNFKI